MSHYHSLLECTLSLYVSKLYLNILHEKVKVISSSSWPLYLSNVGQYSRYLGATLLIVHFNMYLQFIPSLQSLTCSSILIFPSPPILLESGNARFGRTVPGLLTFALSFTNILVYTKIRLF